MKHYMWGLLAMSCLIVAILFFQYWRRSRDRLFILFSVAFVLMAAQWTASAVVGSEGQQPYLLLLRLLSFIAIIIAIVDKNRRDRFNP